MSMRAVAAILYNFCYGRYDEAESLYLEMIEIAKRVLGEEHQFTLIFMRDLADVYVNQGRHDEAERLYLKTLGIYERVLGEAYPGTLDTMVALALMYGDRGRYDEAESLVLQMLEVTRRVLGEEHPETVRAMCLLAECQEQRGDVDLALEILREVAERPGASHWVLNDYAWLLLTAEPEALRDPEAALEIALRANEMSGYRWSEQLYTLAVAYYRTGDRAKATETEQKARDLFPPDRYLPLRWFPDHFQEVLEEAAAGGERDGGE